MTRTRLQRSNHINKMVALGWAIFCRRFKLPEKKGEVKMKFNVKLQREC